MSAETCGACGIARGYHSHTCRIGGDVEYRAAYVCPLCGYSTRFGNPARIALHERVSHSGAVVVVEITP